MGECTQPLPFAIEIDWDALRTPPKKTPRKTFECYERDGGLCFVIYLDPEHPEEPTTMLVPLGDEAQLYFQQPRTDWDWSQVQYIGAGKIIKDGPRNFRIEWGNTSCEQAFGRSHPQNGAEHCQAEDQVRKDMEAFLSMVGA